MLIDVLQAMYYWDKRAVPLSFEHDGISLMVMDTHTFSDLDKLCALINNTAKRHTGIEVGIDIARLVEDC